MNEFFEKNYDNIIQLAKRYSANRYMELAHEAMFSLLNKPPPSFIKALEKGEGMFYMVAVVRMMKFKKNSSFRKLFEYYSLDVVQSSSYSEQMDTYIEAFNEVDRFIAKQRYLDRVLFAKYFDENANFTKLAQDTGIKRQYLSGYIQEVKTKIRAHLRTKGFKVKEG